MLTIAEHHTHSFAVWDYNMLSCFDSPISLHWKLVCMCFQNQTIWNDVMYQQKLQVWLWMSMSEVITNVCFCSSWAVLWCFERHFICPGGKTNAMQYRVTAVQLQQVSTGWMYTFGVSVLDVQAVTSLICSHSAHYNGALEWPSHYQACSTHWLLPHTWLVGRFKFTNWWWWRKRRG